MNYQGCCVAVYSSHSKSNIIKVVKHLQAVNYSDSQISVMGKRVNDTREKSRLMSLIGSFKNKKTESNFWVNLRDLLSGKICFQTSANNSIEVTGALSKANSKSSKTDSLLDSYEDIGNLLYMVGIPKVSFEYYKTVLNNGQLLLIIHGNYQELKRAGNLLDLSGNLNVSMHLSNSN